LGGGGISQQLLGGDGGLGGGGGLSQHDGVGGAVQHGGGAGVQPEVHWAAASPPIAPRTNAPKAASSQVLILTRMGWAPEKQSTQSHPCKARGRVQSVSAGKTLAFPLRF
jgi:hypothetical protein